MTLEPGEYRLHVAAATRGGRTGKVLYDLTVPDWDQGSELQFAGVPP